MSNRIHDMTDDELVSHYRDMQHLTVDTSTKEGISNLAYYQGIVRQMASRFAILVENREIEDKEAADDTEQAEEQPAEHECHRDTIQSKRGDV